MGVSWVEDYGGEYGHTRVRSGEDEEHNAGVQDGGQVGFELDVDDRARDLGDLADGVGRLGDSSHVGSLPRNQICRNGH